MFFMICDCSFCTLSGWGKLTESHSLRQWRKWKKVSGLCYSLNCLRRAEKFVYVFWLPSVFNSEPCFPFSYFLTSVIWLSGFRVDAAWIYFSPFNCYIKLNSKYLHPIKVLQYPFYSMHQSWGWWTDRWQFIWGTETLYSFYITPFV